MAVGDRARDRVRAGTGQRHPAEPAGRQRRWADGVLDGRFEEADSGQFIQAERPESVAERIGRLLDRGPDGRPGAPA
ncbi:hypothetical protein ACFC0M_05155 [Streptomyces sp. NPDC056149]|uniref:hypothetical protein n=1 Tax=unclassified Streptomyces TaxID=2593676 RepID=UPI0023810767|nr:hypothetical protein [Streptomyces sp. WZ-12]